MATQKQALKLAQALEPVLVAQGFVGRFPSFHRMGTHCVECVTVTAHARAGLDVYLGAVPLRDRLEARSAAQDAALYLRYPPPPGTLHLAMRVGRFLLPAELRALPARIASVPARVRTDGRAFWARYGADVQRRARSVEITAAVAAGNAARLAKVLAAMPRAEVQPLLDVTVQRWQDRATIVRTYQLAPVLLRWKPPWMLGALLATGAVLVLDAGAKGGKAAEARRVLAWVKPHLRKVRHLAGQIGILADHLVSGRELAAAAALFDLAAPTGLLGRPQYGNALYASLSANRTEPVERALQQRLVRAALAHAADDPSVRFNIACIEMELGRPKVASAHLAAALELGASPTHATKEPLLRPLLDDPPIAAALGRAPKPRRGAPGFVTHRPPRRG